jgi:hypothetical protein
MIFMSKSAEKKLDIQSIGASLIIGLIAVFGLGWISASKFLTLPFPVLSLLAGYMIAGFTAGILSEDETIAEPAIAAGIVSILLYFILPSLQLPAFKELPAELLLLICLNGVLLAFAGAWAGEKIQGTQEEQNTAGKNSLEWGWVLCGIIVGVMITLLVAAVMVMIFGFKLMPQAAGFIAGVFFTGFIIGWRSPGITIREAAMAGFFTLIVNIDIVTMALIPPDMNGLLIALAAGAVLAMAGGWAGEKLQGNTPQIKA